MSDDKLKYLREVKTKKEADETIVAQLEVLLKKVKAGDIVGLIFISQDPEMNFDYGYSGMTVKEGLRYVGYLEVVKQVLLDHVIEECDKT